MREVKMKNYNVFFIFCKYFFDKPVQNKIRLMYRLPQGFKLITALLIPT